MKKMLGKQRSGWEGGAVWRRNSVTAVEESSSMREKAKDEKWEEEELTRRSEVTGHTQKNHEWQPISGHQTRVQVVGDSMLVVNRSISYQCPTTATCSTIHSESGMKVRTPSHTGREEKSHLVESYLFKPKRLLYRLG